MAKSVRANLQLASLSDIRSIIALDARDVTSQPDRYEKANLLGYYVLINTWLLLIKQWSEHGWIYVLDHMTTFGLFDLIRKFDAAALQIVRGLDIEFSLVRSLRRDVISKGSLSGIPTDDVHEFNTNPTATLLFLLRYGKRFSPLYADTLRDQALEGFITLQKDLKFFQRSFNLGFIEPWIREACLSLVNWDKLCDELEAVDITDIVFTPGVSFDTKADLVSKLKAVAKVRVEYFPQPFGIPMLAHSGCAEAEFWGKYNQYEVHKVRISAVPKNYKSARIIAPEDVVRQATARRYFQIMDRYTPSEINLHDQTQNQRLAHDGSVDGSLATIDLSSASDRITWPLIEAMFPQRFVEVIRRVLPTHYVFKDVVRQLQSAATMGNSITFWLESLIFASIAKAASRFYSDWTGSNEPMISVYGDDIIVLTEAAPTVCEFLEKCGFVVNHDKSYMTTERPFYRESCGEEYYDGRCVSSVYFPRFPLEGSFGKFSNRGFRDSFRGTIIDTMASMIDLQHKMYYTCIPASLLLVDLIREADPKMTASAPDEGFSDIYAFESQPVITPAPAGEWVNGKLKRCVVDGQFREGHSACIWAANRTKDYPEYDKLLVDLYKYQQFLRLGPRYETPLDQLLGVSAPAESYAEASLDGSLKWVLIK